MILINNDRLTLAGKLKAIGLLRENSEYRKEAAQYMIQKGWSKEEILTFFRNLNGDNNTY
jgi:hypothetical protein